MKIPAEIESMLLNNPNGEGYIPQDGLTEVELNQLKEINAEYKKLYDIDLITF